MRPSRFALPAAALLVVSVALSGCSAPAASTSDGKDGRATVVRVIDGDTFVAKVGSAEETVRLLNLDTPETKDPDEPVECFGPEATEKLTSLLSAGDEVTLEYDVERHDQYGRTLAGVYKDKALINAEMARQGLGVSMLVEPNHRFYDEVAAAEAEAREAKRGLFGAAEDSPTAPDGEECSLQALAATAQADAGDALAATVDDSESAATAIVATAAALATTRKALGVVENGDDAGRRLLRQLDQGATAKALRSTVQKLKSKESELSTQKKTFAAAEEKERRRVAAAKEAAEAKAKAAKIEAERKEAAKKAAAQRAAAAKAAAKKAASKKAAAQRQAAARRQQAVKPKPKRKSSGSSSSGSSGGYSGYTGPRCYAPGGKSWKPC